MREEILINVNDFETRVALLQEGALQELHLQRSGTASVTGNLYRGRVERILPGMQAAFVDIGLERPGFLHVKDIRLPLPVAPWDEAGEATEEASAGAERTPEITDLIAEGESLLVQVAKDPIASKGARLTTHVALASRSLVLMPFTRHVGVSQRIEDDGERERLREVLQELREAEGECGYYGFIVRTAAEGAGAEELTADALFLHRMWERIQRQDQRAAPGALVYEELPVHIRVIRDLVGRDIEAIRVDCAHTYERIARFVERFLPEVRHRLEHYDAPTPLFDRFGVEEEVGRALDARVPLKSGGHIVIEQTEAMTTVDVNTGGFVGSRNLEETVFRTNLEAAAIVPRQLRLRNLGGLIVIDFIDMEDAEHQRQVLRTLEKGCEADPARTRICGISSLGLVEMSRKRTRESLAQQLCAPCDACTGRGFLKTAESMCFEVFRAILRDADKRARGGERVQACSAYQVRASQLVVDRLLDENAADVEALAARVGLPIRIQVEPIYTAEQFDVVLMQGVR